MALRISFKPGVKQSQQAARYFHATVDTLVEEMIDALEEHAFFIRADEGPSLWLRTWCAEPMADEELHALFDWLLELRTDLRVLQDHNKRQEHLEHMVSNWLSVRMGGADLFVELAMADPETGAAEKPQLALGMLRGRSVMISTDDVLFTWLEQDVFGLSLAGQGSYLLELAERGNGGALRKAS